MDKLYIPLNKHTVRRIARLHNEQGADPFDEEWLFNELEQIAALPDKKLVEVKMAIRLENMEGAKKIAEELVETLEKARELIERLNETEIIVTDQIRL